MDDRPTPETDAARAELQRMIWTTKTIPSVETVPVDFARRLERERDDARRELAEARDEIQSLYEDAAGASL